MKEKLQKGLSGVEELRMTGRTDTNNERHDVPGVSVSGGVKTLTTEGVRDGQGLLSPSRLSPHSRFPVS